MNIGIVGTNFISGWMAETAAYVPGTDMYAVYSRKEETGRAFAEKYGIKKVYSDYGVFLADKNIDAVYIASPNFAHCGQSIEAMNAGKHVLCEKTIASDSREFELMKEAARKNKVVLLEAMRPAFDPEIARIKESFDRIGEIRRVSFEYCQYSSRYDRFKSGEILNAFNPAFSNAAVMDIGVYCIYTFVKLFGRPESIKSFSTKLSNGMEGHGSLIMQCGGMIGEISYSKIIDSVNPSVIQGENGSIIVDNITVPGNIKIIYRDGREEQILKRDRKTEPRDNMKYELSAFAEFVGRGVADSEYITYSTITLEIIDEIRKQNNIVFSGTR